MDMRAQCPELKTRDGDAHRCQREDLAPGAKESPGVDRYRVLVVDGDSLVCWAVAESLRAAGFDAVEVPDLAQAMRVLSASDVELAFLELGLPDAQDFHVLAAIRRRSPRLPVVLMTAHDSDEIRRDALKLGVVTVLKKPFDLAEIGPVAGQALLAPLN